ncbi:iron-containing redox enzyme family protein [Mycobacterium sp. OTB74]|uniref:iron-containing redox enzyme family protein n=1 Tax=Mycobacterium sp. OTB74 TaxID=1853452 RepID=UPI002473FA4E|nr:iron-containing redox enzyme family protein [Mycobacterium sp. OTB74]MDH6242644.1 hypothetical protein [Mycobacterium sp. OTB74]
MAADPGVDAYTGLKDRDYFHIMLNLDSYDGFLPTARTLADGYLHAARDRQTKPGLEDELRPFAYTPQDFETRMNTIYQGLAKDVSEYETQQSWTARTKDDVLEWLLQMAPFNQTDGAWLRTIAQVGPMDELHALLFSIYADELGDGDPALNHPNLYTKLLRSAGFDLPDIRSRPYTDNPDIVDAAFTLPLFQLVVSQFPQHYLPELLGMTLYLEWGSIELKNMVLLNQHFGLDTEFYEVHVSIDNAATGHGAKALRAVEVYLEQVRIDSGDDAVQQLWARIWDGYVAFATTGDLANQVAEKQRRQQLSPADAVAAMITARAPIARLNHGSKTLGGKLINDLFADPPALMDALVKCGLVTPGDPAHSPFFELTTPTGPMFRIFTDAELDSWRAWFATLASTPAPAPAPAPDSAAGRMQQLIDALRTRQQGVAAHQSVLLTDDDPDCPGKPRSESVAWWFERPTAEFLATLARSQWVIAGDAEHSRLITEIVRGNNAMAQLLADAAPGVPGAASGATKITDWINAGCPAPDAEPAARPITLLTPADRVAAHPHGRIHGSGSVH